MKITVIGGGYVGLVSAACFAELGNHVTVIEIDSKKVDMINAGVPPIYEKGLEELLKKHSGKNLVAKSDYNDISLSDISVICVGTPPLKDGSANLSYIKSAAGSIGGEIKKNPGHYHVVAVKSTVPPGTTENIVAKAVLEKTGGNQEDVGFVMNPEFLREGLAVEDFMNPDRVVIGSSDEKAGDVAEKMYENLCARILRTGLSAAEMIKYTSNAFLATKISFSNEIGNICKKLGIDVYEVMGGVGMDKRISPMFLNAGAGFGGSCFPKDVMALVSLAEKIGEKPVLLKSVLDVNETQPLKMVEILEKQTGSLKGKKIAVLGLAFKDNTDDIRESRSIPVIKELILRGALVSAYDPLASSEMRKIYPAINYSNTAGDALTDADGCLVMTEWPEFSRLSSEFDLMKDRVIIEGRRILDITDSEGICW
ncbi:UDP-glucose/GDP-mannose dehydrogenase family protein [Methanoplanus sp. FWC-SCC4]|uniref:UDP-glucose 6-dehydrogenase n=1 Tax=Methanochimaera problematica TaxID=2609417 RepID=A0AA97FBH4_9EURY|nr:UDP-glucose/GDP-mannose dehydrogenase family protein [Methanoplanus sp. FWC-SCC4]WOF16375.1 UDP-glucose/GDP-mannose dehydrogenase family protein [Methanoplanus sp. FWC-SCC4]